jgi:hypothetical protein
MTEERKPATAGQETDERVTQAYRELATERAPDHLDQAVLAKARAAARPQYSRLRSWTRPLAWAATVMLSVAVVLQIDQTPGPESISFGDAASQSNKQASEAEVPATEAVRDASSDMPSPALLDESPAAAPARSLSAATDDRDDAAVGRAAAKKATPEPALEQAQPARQLQESRLEQQPAALEAGVDAFAPQDRDMLQRAAEMARTQTGENKNSVPEARADGALELSSIGLRDELPTCEEPATRTPETWLECIAELEEAGFRDEARLERELLRREFPDFEAR